MNTRLGDLLPMPPGEGPPLPRALRQRCPGKGIELEMIDEALVRAIIKADADYFYSMDFISQPTYQAVLSWLEGKEDSQTHLMVANWLEADAEYFIQVTKIVLNERWWLYPAWLMLRFIPRQLKEYA